MARIIYILYCVKNFNFANCVNFPTGSSELSSTRNEKIFTNDMHWRKYPHIWYGVGVLL